MRPRVVEYLRLLALEDFPVDLIVWPRHLSVVIKLLERIPYLRCALDHLAKPDVGGRAWQPWADDLATIGKHNLAFCKLSGMITMADPTDSKWESCMPHLQYAWQAFGPDRVMFGSDWPVSTLAGSYADTLEILRRNIANQLDDSTAARSFGLNCAAFYSIE